MNRTEKIAYWYLRLNGFFMLNNFVVHRPKAQGHSSEIDILALRPPLVFEEVGGRNGDWDENFITSEDNGKFIGIICEVKSGKGYSVDSIFREREIEYAMNRFGILNKCQKAEVSKKLIRKAKETIGSGPNFEVRKILIGEKLKNNVPPCKFIQLNDAYDFLRDRMSDYKDEKKEARTLFKSDMVDELLHFLEN